MSARPSAAVERALRLVARGITPYAAAKKTGIALSTIYRARRRQRQKQAAVKPAPVCALCKGRGMLTVGPACEEVCSRCGGSGRVNLA